MNSRIFGRAGLFLLASLVAVRAAVFTTDTPITANDSSFDGQDIVVTNCTVTLDGAHGFNSLRVLNGGVLTHSPYTNFTQTATNMVTGEAQILSSTNPPTLNNPNVDNTTILVTDQSGTITYTNGTDYVVTVIGQNTQLSFPATNTSAIADGATVLVSYNWTQTTTIAPGFNLTISNDTQIAAGGTINISGKGYLGGNGSGAGGSRSTTVPYSFTAGAGGSHGGYGAMSTSGAPGGNAYGSITIPGSAGSGGGAGSAAGASGGGVAQLMIGGALQLDGQIFAQGLAATNAHAGGGAGGSIYLSARTFSGSGIISANGGSGELPDGGGGGGGRIAIYFATNNFAGSISAFGGAGANIGGAGTIFLQATDAPAGNLLIVNGGKRGTNTVFSQMAISNLTLGGGAIAQCSPPTLTVSNFFLGTNTSFIPADNTSGVTLTVTGDATIQSNATVSVDSRATTGISGWVSCSSGNSGTGGSYGGFGGAGVCGRSGGNITYGSITQPNATGTPGGTMSGVAPRGGGAVRLIVGGTLSTAGKISADGASGAGTSGAGGGSGGSVWITAGTVVGNGIISANGGAANNPLGGGGSGGRVAIYFGTNLFSGVVSASGGTGANGGGAGTVYLQYNNAVTGSVIVNNGGVVGAVTPLPSILSQSDLTITGGAIVSNNISTSISLNNLFIGANSWFQFASGTYPPLTASNAVIQSGGGIAADGLSTSTAGAGQTSFSTGGGGEGAGYGGNSASNAPGGFLPLPFGIISAPNFAGAIGGAGYNGTGGYGGGIINLTVNGTLQLDGKISADGAAASVINSGGGGGGSVYLRVGTIMGGGTLSAVGGTGNNAGGGGGGGFVTVYSITNSFAGNMTAYGGRGANYGGAGIVYTARTPLISNSGLPGTKKIIVDNAGVKGAMTPIQSPGGDVSDYFDLTLNGGAVATNNSNFYLENLTVSSNSTLITSASFTVWTNASIFPGGKISADAQRQSGSFSGSNGGGGGYGGRGGAPAGAGYGGNTAGDPLFSPNYGGSPGAYASGFNGGFGGGMLKMTVNGKVQLDGIISADGGSATNSAGGGSGGAVWILATTFSGTGSVSANGGNGGTSGGGGGGGRIAVWYNTNLFSGNFTARGGTGANGGGAGTIFLNPSFSGAIANGSSLIVDNGGVSGAYTPVYGVSSVNFQVLGDANVTNITSISPVANLVIGSNSSVYMSQPLTVLSNATIQTGGWLTSDGFSAGGNAGLSVNSTGGGGGYGGVGGASSSNAPGGSASSDSLTSPQNSGGRGGSGLNGYSGGYGGGPLHLTVNGTLQLDGKISCDGAGSPVVNGGGGSGGALWVQAAKIIGAGTISASGGSGNSAGGGGGGGRVALWCTTNLFAGSLAARGGAGANYGGAGTVYTTSSYFGNGASSRLIIDNGGAHGTNTVLNSTITGDVTITNGAMVSVSSGATTWNNLTIASNATLNFAIGGSSLSMNVFGKLLIQPGGAISIDGQGSAANNGTGHGLYAWNGSSYVGSGGGHGGIGSMGNSTAGGGTSFDDITNPSLAGSGGGVYGGAGSAGGGALRLTVTGLATIDGTISANGQTATAQGGGGGAGGTVWLSAGGIAGAGKISADGGAGDPFAGGGGAGGRIALLPLPTGPGTFTTNGFTGTFSARGGAGFAMAGGAGTIYLKTNYPGAPLLIVDNGGSVGTNTPLSSLAPTVALTVRNGAAANSTSPLTLQTLSIVSNGTFNVINPLTTLNLTVLGDASIASDSSIIADAAGFSYSNGTGVGAVDSSGNGSGGGYGGVGGMSWLGASGGTNYGSAMQPNDYGSPGGMSPTLPNFSQGGGAIRLAVMGHLGVNGVISANGNDGVIEGSGGGSGGSIWIDAKTVSGTGTIAANGGTGEFGQGGGGGGGRIAVYLATNAFGGNVFVSGGDGASPGQDGTIYFQTNLIISGGVFDTNGAPLAGITLQPDGFGAISTDTNGFYSITVPLFWSGNIVPSGGGYFYVPTARTYATLQTNAPAQNFLAASSVQDFSIGQIQPDGGINIDVQWHGISGAIYQPLYSTNLVDWLPYGSASVGTNGPMSLTLPANAPQMYFRLSVSY